MAHAVPATQPSEGIPESRAPSIASATRTSIASNSAPSVPAAASRSPSSDEAPQAVTNSEHTIKITDRARSIER